MRTRLALIRLGCLFFVLGGEASFGGVLANSTADFSGTQGVKNWYYGYFPGGNVNAFTQLPTFNVQAQQWQHTTFGPPWTLVGANSALHPNGTNSGTEEWATREWVSVYAGQVIISGHLAKEAFAAVPASTGVYGRIYQNHQLVYEQFVAGTDSQGVSYSLTLTVRTGDVIDFAIAPNGADVSDSTLFSATVSSEYDAVSVDFGRPMPVKPALGFLHGFDLSNPSSANSPPINLISPLQPQYWRTAMVHSYYTFIRSFAPSIPVDLIVSDVVRYPGSNYNGNGPPWQNLLGFQSTLKGLLASFVPLPSNIIVEPWNEPDDGWAAWAVGTPAYREF